jgi:hypothetical protein
MTHHPALNFVLRDMRDTNIDKQQEAISVINREM